MKFPAKLEHAVTVTNRLKKQICGTWLYPLRSFHSGLSSGVQESNNFYYNESKFESSSSGRVRDTRRLKRSRLKNSGIGHGSWKVGRKTNSRRVKIREP